MKEILEILENIRPDSDFKDSKDFIADALLDSFDIMTLVSELESTFGASIDTVDIVPENFLSLDTLAQLVRGSGGSV